jgi:hypothetical protein
MDCASTDQDIELTSAMAAKKWASLRWADAVLDADLSAKAKLVGLTCAVRWMHRDHLNNVRPGTPLLMHTTGLGRRSVTTALQELRAAGLLVLVKKGGYGKANLYAAQFPNRPRRTWWCAGGHETKEEQALDVFGDPRPVCIKCVNKEVSW